MLVTVSCTLQFVLVLSLYTLSLSVSALSPGYLNPEACIEAYLLMASKHGAELRHHEAMAGYAFQRSGSGGEDGL